MSFVSLEALKMHCMLRESMPTYRVHLPMLMIYTCPHFINPWRACSARVTVLGLCVCLSVCLSTPILALQATRRPMSYTNGFRSTRA